jgi:hypothetical protein
MEKGPKYTFFNKIKDKTKLIIISFLILIIGFLILQNVISKDSLQKLEESKKKTENKLRSISLYEGHLDGYTAEATHLSEQAASVEKTIDLIKKEKTQNISLDKFFDERVK